MTATDLDLALAANVAAAHAELDAAGWPRMGDIGEPVRTIEFEPMPTTIPIQEPSPAVTPEPEKVPA